MTTKLKLTPEMLERLKNCTGFEIGNTFKYVPKDFRMKDESGNYVVPKEFWPVFTLKSKDGLEIAKIEDNSGFVSYRPDGSTEWHGRSGEKRIATLEAGIVKIKNLPLENGDTFLDYDSTKEEIAINDKVSRCAGRDVIKYLRVPLQIELQEAINERSVLTEEELRGLES
jgi:hypothetical protein